MVLNNLKDNRFLRACSCPFIGEPHAFYIAHRQERIIEMDPKNQELNPINSHIEAQEKKRQYARSYTERNRDKIREYHREYRQVNRERLLEYRRQYRRRQKEKAQQAAGSENPKLYLVYSLSLIIGEVHYIYIGSTENLTNRYNSHWYGLWNGTHPNRTLRELFAGGYTDLKLEVLDYFRDKNESLAIEQAYIEHFKRIEGFHVCNMNRPAIRHLEPHQARLIAKALQRGISGGRLAKHFKISKHQIYNLRHNRTHKQALKTSVEAIETKTST